jgi:lysine-N-methylase
MSKRTVLQPEYLSRFSCIGGACEDSCCVGGWNIFVDKKTFLKYRDVEDKDMKAVLDKVVKRNRGKNASDANYASFRLMRNDKDKSCMFLSKDRLCHIQNTLGYGYLCDVCAIYPRFYKMADKKLERCATMSCPEAVRAALQNPDGIAFETAEIDPKTNRIPPRVAAIDTRQTKLAAKSAKFFWDVRLWCLTLLQNREYTIGQRLIILGMLCHNMDELEKKGGVEAIPALLEDFGNEIESGALKQSLGAVKNNLQIQLKLAKELADERLSMEYVANENYIKCTKETLAGLDCFVDTPAEDILKKYAANRETYVADYLKEKDYVLENFLVNEFFMRLMPFGTGDTAFESYMFLCILYAMVKLHINGMSGYHKGLTDETVFRAIQSFSKVVLHNQNFMANMIKVIKANGYDTLAWMTILVND